MNNDFNLIFFFWYLLVSALLILSSISFLIYRYSKEKSFLYYSLYSLVLLAYIIIKAPYNELAISSALNNSKYAPLNWYIQACYYVFYSYFILHFLDIKKLYPKLYKNLKHGFNSLLLTFTLLFILCVIINNKTLYTTLFLYGFSPIMLCLAIYLFYGIRKIKGKIKQYIIAGVFIYLFFVLMALYFTITKTNNSPLFFFYIGVIIEQFVFSFGLAYKVKLINEDRNTQYQENKRIKATQYKILNKELKKKEKEIFEITAKSEQERLSKVKHEFESRIQRLKLDSLQSQMNPHFIFNVLNSIKLFLIENDKQNAVYYLNKFSKLIRKVLEGSRVNQHTLKEEIEILKLYLTIENIRFNNKIKIIFNLADIDSINTLKIPPLILQPFAENALWHGLASSKKEPKIITLNTFVENNLYKLSITDNGIGRKKSEELKKNKHFKKKSVGLKLSQERLDYFNEDKKLHYQFYFTDIKDQNNKQIGTKVTFVFNTTPKTNNP